MRLSVWWPAVLAIFVALAMASPTYAQVTTDCEPCAALAQALNETIAEAKKAGAELEAAKAELDVLEAERERIETEMSAAENEGGRLVNERERLKAAGDAEGAAAADRAQQAAFDRAIELLNELEHRLEPRLFAARDKVAELAEALAKIVERLTAQQAALTECEKQCAPPPPPAADTMPDPPREPTVVDPRGFVVTDCLPCRKLAADLNEVVGTLAARRTELASVEAAIPGLSAALEQAEEAKSRATDEAEAHRSEAERQRRAGNEAAAEAATDREIDAIQAGHRAQSEIFRLTPQLARAEARRAALNTEIAGLEQRVASLRAELAECEKQCAGGDDGSEAVAVPSDDPFEPAPEPPEPGFVTTDCELCEEIASALNSVVGTMIADEAEIRSLTASIPELEEGIRDAEYEEARALDEFRLQSTLEDDYRRERREEERQAAADKASAASARIEKARAEADYLIAELERVRERIEALEADIEQLKEREAELRAALAECEKQCAEEPADEEGGVALPDDEEAAEPVLPEFATTDCEPCEQIVSRLNGVVGSIITTERDVLPKAREAVAAAEQAVADAEAEKQAAENEAGRRVDQAARLRQDGNEAGARVADGAKDAAYKRAADLLNRIEFELEPVVDKAKADVERLEQRLADLRAQEQQLRADLADCEKQCAEEAPGEDSGVALPEDDQPRGDAGVITTDCPACEDLATALNETADRRRAASEALGVARDAYDEIRRSLDRAQEAADAAMEEGSRAAVAATRARQAGDQAAVDEAVARQEEAFTRATNQLDIADDLSLRLEAAQQAVETARAAFDALDKLFAEQAAELLECEKKCREEDRRTGLLTTPKFGIEVVQVEDECDYGAPCTIGVTLVNEVDFYDGPVFLSADIRPIDGGGDLGGWFCGFAPKQSSLCYTDAEDLEQGATLTLIVPFTPTDGEVCVAVEVPEYGSSTKIGAGIQLGLTMEGFDLGSIDGQIGPKTLAAVDDYLASDGSDVSDEELRAGLVSGDPEETAATRAALFERLFGHQPVDLEEYDEMLDCIELKLRAKQIDDRTIPDRGGDDGENLPDAVEDDDFPTPRIGIEFDFGDDEEREEERNRDGFEIPGFNPLGDDGPGGFTIGF